MKIKTIAVVGPTASGKTDLAIMLAEKFDGEIVSADSMQIYKGLEISTAKPTKDEQNRAHHHMIDFLEVTEKFDVTQYVEKARECILDIDKRGKLPIIAGGTGLYTDSLLNGIEFAYCPDDTEIREELNRKFDEIGSEEMLEELRRIDPETGEKLHANDRTRIIRALSVYRLTGETISENKRKSREKGSDFDCLWLGIDYTDRKKLYDRIDKRVDIMIENGLIDEARQFYKLSGDLTSAQAIGVKELKGYLDREETLDECVQRLKFATHHYAKRQLTWIRKNKEIHWLTPDTDENYREKAAKLVREFLNEEERKQEN